MKTPLFLLAVPAVLCIAQLTMIPPSAHAAQLEAGVAVVDVTPPLGYRISGYFHQRLGSGTHDPLLAKAIVFRQGDQRAALVLCDVIGISPDLSAEARRMIQQKTGIPASCVLVAATHTHTGPLYCGALRRHLHDRAVAETGTDAAEKVDYPERLARGIAQAVEDAAAAARPVKLQTGVAQQQGLSFNRRFHLKTGPPVRFNPGKLNPNIIRPAGPIDPDVGLLLLRDAADNRALASLSVFALHLDTVGGTEYSADYPFYLQESLREALGERFVSIFANGTCGDINHVDVSHNRPQKGHEEARRIGETLAATVKTKLPELTDVARPMLGVRTEVIDVPLKKPGADELAWARETMKQVDSRQVAFLDRVKAYNITSLAAMGKDTLPMTVQVFRLGPEVAIVALPGEVFVDLGLAIKRASPFPVTMVVELAHDAPGYIPTKKAFAEGSYETINSRIRPGGGEMLVETAVRLLKGLAAE